MKLPRISIKKLMAFIGLIAVVLAVLAHPNNGWFLILAPSYFILLLTAIMGCILGRGPRRAGWLGFSLFGWSYFLSMSFGWGMWRIISHQTNNSPFGLFQALEDLLGLLMSITSINREQFGDLYLEMVGEDDVTRIRVSLILMGLVFAMLGARIARLLFRLEHPAASRPPSSDGEHGGG